MSAPDSFQARVKSAVKGKYQTSMRRSLQSVALYEADRCLKYRYSQLRPFQRKYALYSTAVDLISTLDFLNEYHRQEIMFRTNASKEPLAPDLAWRRMKLISREINQTILPKATEVMGVESDEEQKYKTHEEVCALILQNMYAENNKEKNSSKPYPPMWEFNHNNVFIVYRIYYRGTIIDPKIFPPRLLRMVPVPLKKPDGLRLANGDLPTIPLAGMTMKGRAISAPSEEDRRAMLKEVKEHTELLKQFEGVIPDEELDKRKRALYEALPPVPPPLGTPASLGGKRKRDKKKKVKQEQVAVKVPTIPEMPKPVAAATPDASEPMATEEDEDWDEVVADSKDEASDKNVAAVQV